jgi:hypothetical protein
VSAVRLSLGLVICKLKYPKYPKFDYNGRL